MREMDGSILPNCSFHTSEFKGSTFFACRGFKELNTDTANVLVGANMDVPVINCLIKWSMSREVSERLEFYLYFSDNINSVYVGENIRTNQKLIFKEIRSHLCCLLSVTFKIRPRAHIFLLRCAESSTHFRRMGDFIWFTD